jgi:preprotein translocase subunit SecF
MEIIRPDININFVGMRFKALFCSGLLTILGVAMMFAHGGLNLGIDFAGGTLIQVRFQEPTSPDAIRAALSELGTGHAAIQRVGSAADNEFLIRAEHMTTALQDLSKTVEAALVKTYGEGKVAVRRAEMVGPKVGEDLKQKALFAIYYTLLLITIYISGRFEMKWATSAIMAAIMVSAVLLLQALGLPVIYLIFGALIIALALCWLLKLPYALGAVVALIHDVIITIGVFAIFNKEFTLEVVAAILTLAGYSLNDTIIVYDRIRENVRKYRREDPKKVINDSINQTLSRTILTSGCTMLVVAFLFFLGGSVIHDFAFAMMIGVFVGTYSSIFIASPLLILYHDWTMGRGRGRVAARSST